MKNDNLSARPLFFPVIAKAMVRTALAGMKGVHVWPSDKIAERGGFTTGIKGYDQKIRDYWVR